MFNEDFEVSSRIYAVPFITESLRKEMHVAHSRDYNGPVMVSERLMSVWMQSLIYDGNGTLLGPSTHGVPYHPDLLDPVKAFALANRTSILRSVHPTEGSAMDTYASHQPLYDRFVKSVDWAERWRTSFRVGRPLRRCQPNAEIQVQLMVGI
jgi:hypothetical protein